MRNGQFAGLLVVLMLLPGVATAIHYIQPADWSWRGGLIGPAIEGDVFGNDPGYPGFFCEDCRDPEKFPVDYAAFAYNGYWGDDPWMFDARLGIPFRIYNDRLDWVVVWFEYSFLDSLAFLPDTLDIRIRLESGKILTVTVLQGGPDMPIGSSEPAPLPESCTCDGGDGGESDDSYTDPDDYEMPDIDPVIGTVEIVDPDGYGEFPTWEEEL